MKTVLIPKGSRLVPTKKLRSKARNRIQKYPESLFECYADWFFFVHIDPVQRYIHAIGMIIGIIFYIIVIIEWSIYSIIYYLIGAFFFYGLGVVSHILYDSSLGRSRVRNYHQTLFPVIKFNLRTLFGNYDQKLREFIHKYPFTLEAFDLIEIEKKDIWSYLIKK